MAALAALLLSSALVLLTFSAAPLPMPSPLPGELPAASPPAAMSVHRLSTGVTHRSAAFAYRGGSFWDDRDFSMAAVLVKHPKGDLLIDTGFGRDIDQHFAMMPWAFRVITSYDKRVPARAQLDAAGYDAKKLRGIVLTHAHWDHVSGVGDFPDIPVLVTAAERRFIRDGGTLSTVARSFTQARYEEYGFEDGPFLGFAKSHDLYHDGAIVLVPAPGHTPGSVIVFLALPNTKRYAFVGDLCWQLEGISEREERPWIQRSLADDDAAGVRANLLRMAAIAARFPELQIVPAHDARAMAKLPGLE